MMKIHLVYAFQPGTDRLDSPFCITNNLHKYLSERAEVIYDVWDAVKVPKADPDAIFIGHPHYEHNTIVQQAFRQDVKFKAKCSIHPFHHVRPEDNWPFNHIAQKADKIFSICGPYWYDTVENSMFKDWKPKMVRLDMGLDSNHFPYLKTSFNPIGKRKLVYIGSTMPQKNLGFLTRIMENMPDVTLKWYGGNGDHPLAKLPNVEVTGWVRLDSGMAKHIVSECDIFVSTSVSDANPTTLLEARAWGLITACTPQSGYYNDEFFTELDLCDFDKTLNAIRSLLNADENVLLDRSKRSREDIEVNYNWDKFCKTVWTELQKLDNAQTS